ncbi:MAG TPA: tetratricopeptide repeat protein [Kofleriaceae bacterium]|jgi:tetratricopeptide (TPR) repeat protein
MRAGTALDAAGDREEVFEAMLRAARSRLSVATLLTVHHAQLRGWRCLAEPQFDVRGVETLEIPRDVPAFETVIATSSPSIGPIATNDAFIDGLLELMGGISDTVLVLPVNVRMHCIALIVGHRGSEPITYAEVSDLFPLVADADSALERVLAVRARSAATRARTSSEPAAQQDSTQRRAQTISHRKSARWPELAESIREEIRDGVDHGTPGEDEQLELLYELGTIELTHLRRPEAAIEAWRSALAIDASDERVLDALERLYAQSERWEDCVELLERRVAMIEKEASRIPVLLNLAAIAREKLNDPGAAIDAYERIVGWEPGHKIASTQLEELYAARNEWGPVASQMLDRASRDSDPRQSLDALVEVAAMYEHKVGDPRAAALVWLAVLRRDASHEAALAELERIAPAADSYEELAAEATAIAEELWRQTRPAATAAGLWHLIGQWSRDHLADRDAAVHAFEESLANAGDDEMLAAALHIQLGELLEAEPDEAIVHYEKALAHDPEDAPLLGALHRLYLQRRAWTKLAALLPRLIDAVAPTAGLGKLVELNIELGAIYADQLDRPADAIAAYQDAIALDPAHELAHRSLVVLYERSGQTEELLEAREAEADIMDGVDQARAYRDVATAWHDQANYDRAAHAWRKLLSIDPDSAVARQGLADTLRADGQWTELTDSLRGQLRRAGGEDKLVALELAEVQAKRLGDVDGATATIEDILARNPGDVAALDTLARLHEQAGRARPALAALSTLLGATTDAHGRADLLQRVGQLHLVQRDAVAARKALTEAISLDLDNADAREAMARVHIQQGELVAAGDEMLRAARLHVGPSDVLRCLADAAWLYRHRIGDTERAREILHRILELKPDHGDAKQALAELLSENQEWGALWPHLEEQVMRAQADDAMLAVDKRDVYIKAARCAIEIGRIPRALELYDAAASVAPGPAVQIERAEALYRATKLEAAAMALQTLATDAVNLERPQRIAVFRRLAQILTELGRGAQAAQFHGKVLDLDPRDKESLTELAELHLAAARYDDAIMTLRSLSEVPNTPASDRAALLERIGDLYRDQLSNAARATSIYLDALDLDGSNRRVLQRLLDLQTAAGQWTRAVETIERFLDHEADPTLRAAYHVAAAKIRRAELRDNTGARASLERALDDLLRDQPVAPDRRRRALELFRDLDGYVHQDRDWKFLDQAYRRMIKRMPANDPALLILWHALGELYRTHLDHPQSAIEAFEVAHALDPDKSPARTKTLVELYARIGALQAPEKAVSVAAKLAEADPSNPDTYRSLVRTALAAGNRDEAWCAARALVVLKLANADEERLYKKYQQYETRKANGILDEDAWAHVRSADEDRVLSAIFAIIWESLVALRAGSARSFELKPKDRIPVDDDRAFGRAFRHASRTLNASLPDVYVQPRRPGGLLLANCVEKGRLTPAVIIGRDMMTGYHDAEIAAAVAAMVALLRPAYYLKLAMTTNEELEAAIAAAAFLVGKKVGRPELQPLVQVFAPQIRDHLTRPTAEALLALADRVPERPDLARWRTAVDVAAQRSALLVSGDLTAAARMTALGGPNPTQRVRELVAYSVSPGYFAARKHLGVALPRTG